MKNRVLITGAFGNVGTRLIRGFDTSISKNLKLLDNLEKSQRHASLCRLSTHLNYEFIWDDILIADLNKYLKDVKYVIHLAALTSVAASRERPEEFKAINFEGLQRIADACLKSKVKLLFPSTHNIYGGREAVIDETCKELKAFSPYGETKLASEKYLEKLKNKGLKYIICRFGTIFGHSLGMRFDTAVNKFIWQAVNNIPLTVWKTAWKQKRPYLYLGDCVGAINFLLKKDIFDGEIYNVLTDNHTVEDIVQIIRGFIPTLTINYTDPPPMNQFSYDVSNQKLRNLGFEPTGNLKKGISETITQLKPDTIDK